MDAPAAHPRLTIRGMRTVAVEVPMTFPLGTSATTIRSAPLLLIDLDTEEGITGRTYLFCYRPSGARAIAALLEDAVALVKGERAAPVEIAGRLNRRFALIGVTGLMRMALSGLDCALWDALAVAAGLPLVSFLGGTLKPVPAYNSNGLGLMEPAAVAEDAARLLEGGFSAVKLRLGHETLEADLATMRAVRRKLPDMVSIMVDYNQALSRADAIRRGVRSRPKAPTGSRSRSAMTTWPGTRRSPGNSPCRSRSARTLTARRTWRTLSRRRRAITSCPTSPASAA